MLIPDWFSSLFRPTPKTTTEAVSFLYAALDNLDQVIHHQSGVVDNCAVKIDKLKSERQSAEWEMKSAEKLYQKLITLLNS